MASERVYTSQHPLIKQKLAILRDKTTLPVVFRRTVSEIATLLAVEATTDLRLEAYPVTTPLAQTTGEKIAERIALVPILRAGLGMVEGIWQLIPDAQVWHLGVFRDHETLKPVPYYNKMPAQPRLDLCLVLDPMLATGGSAIAAIDMLRVQRPQDKVSWHHRCARGRRRADRCPSRCFHLSGRNR